MARDYQIKMSLMFNANTSKAKASLLDLQKSLNAMTNSITSADIPFTKDLKEAYTAAEKLKKILNESINMDTGKFDLSKFSAQLKQSGMSVQTLSADFAKAGSQGVAAFNSLTSAIANAEIPARRMHKTLDSIAKSLKDTLRWELSSSVIHGLVGSLQSAYDYAKDLNKSLNDIRIVTDEGADFMARFAEQANKAAKSLSSTTNEYAKAALIFYQQGGMTEEEVAERTAATIKMANVTGESARDISSYMTAIWNNFNDGTKSLEYYADAITALGAATASSSEEIANGMQHFASIGNTVGLSYEYAASALATVVAATRQSEDTVGTSFKTIFSRLSSLQLGETLEDGTTLTKYSAALATVGVDIKDSNDKLKDMDTILDELGTKWQEISAEQKNALAYTVAGSRQYNNFIALLDNYKTFKVNVDIAADSEGTLDEQQRIYAESWEAAANRVRAASEGIFQDLINDKFFIGLLDTLEKIISMLDKFIDSIGGLPGVLSLVSSLMLKIFNKQVSQSVRDIGYGLSHFLGIAQVKAGKTKADFLAEAQKLNQQMRFDVVGDPMLDGELESMGHKLALEQEYARLENSLTEEQKEQYRIQLSLLDVMRNQKKEKQAAVNKASEKLQNAGVNLMHTADIKPNDWENLTPEQRAIQYPEYQEAIHNVRHAAEAEQQAKEQNSKATKKYTDKDSEYKIAQEFRDEIKANLTDVMRRKGAGFGNTRNGQSQAEAEADKDLFRQYTEWKQAVEQLEIDRNEASHKSGEAAQAYVQAQEKTKRARQSLNDLGASLANPQMDKVAIGETLARYTAYSSGRNEMLESGLKAYLDRLKNLPEGVNTQSKEYQSYLDEIAEAVEQFQDEYQAELGESTNEAIEQIIKEIRTNWKDTDGTTIKPEDVDKFASQIQAASDKDKEQYRKVTSKDLGLNTDQIRAALKEQGVEFSDKAWATWAKQFEDYKKAIEEAGRATENESKVIKNGLDKITEPQKFDLASRITSVTEGLSNLVLVATSLKGIWDTLSDPDLSAWDKAVSVFTALTTVMGSLMSIMQIASLFKKKETEMTLKDTIITTLNSIAQKVNEKARKDAGDAANQQAKNVAKNSDTTSKETLGMAFKNALPALKSMLGPIAGIAAAAAIVATAVAITVKGFNAARDAANKAAKTAKVFADEASQAQQNYNSVVEQVSSYKDAVAGMKEMTKGTEEWNRALLETNQTAFGLIDKFDELAGKYHFEDGLIVFDEGALEAAQQAELEQAQLAQGRALQASVAAKEANISANRIDLARKLNSTTDIGNKIGNAAAATVTGLGAGVVAGGLMTSWSGPGAFIGMGVGGVTGLIAGLIAATQNLTSTTEELSDIDKLVDLYQENPNAFENKDVFREAVQGLSLNLDDDELVKALEDLKPEIQNLANAEQQADAERRAAIYAANADNKAFTNSKYQDEIVSQQINENSSEERDKLIHDFQYTQWGVHSREEQAQMYLEAMYGEEASKYRVRNWLGSSFTIQKQADDGSWANVGGAKNNFDWANLPSLYAEAMLTKLSEEDIQKGTEEAERISAELDKAGITQEDRINSIRASYMNNQTADLSTWTGAQLRNIDLNAITDENLRETISEAQGNAITSWGQIIKQYRKDVIGELNKFDEATANKGYNITRQQLNIYGQVLTDFMNTAGDDATTIFNDNLSKIIDQNADQAQQIMELVTGIDWTNPQIGLAKFTSGMDELGIAVDAWSWQSQGIEQTLGELQLNNGLITDTEYLVTLFEQLNELSSSLTKDGLVSLKHRNALIAAGLATTNDFMSTLNPEQVRYIGDADPSRLIFNKGLKDALNYITNESTNYAGLIEQVPADQYENFMKAWAPQLARYTQTELQTALNKAKDDGAPLITSDREYQNLKEGYTNKGIWTALREARHKPGETWNKEEINQRAWQPADQLQNLPGFDKLVELYLSGASRDELRLKSKEIGADQIVTNQELLDYILPSIKRYYDDAGITRYFAEQQTDLLSGARAEQFKKLIGSAATLEQLQELKANPLFDTLFKDEDVIKSYQEREDLLREMIEKQTKFLDSQEDELRLRERINNELEITRNLYNKISSTNLVSNLFAQRKQTEELFKLDQNSLRNYKSEQRQRINELKKLLPQNFEITRDAQGNITNYEEIRWKAYELDNKDQILQYLDLLQTGESKIQEFTEKVAEDGEWLKSFWVNIGEGVQTYISGVTESIGSYADTINYYKNIIGLVGKEFLKIDSKTLDNIRTASQQTANATYEANKKQYELIKQARVQAEKELERASAATNETEQQEKALEELQRQEQNALKAMNNSFVAALEQAANNLTDSIETIAEEFEKQLTSTYENFEEMSQQFSQLSTLDDQYLEDYEKLYELSKLLRNVDQSIASTQSIKGKQELGELQQKFVDMQAEGAAISDHDLEVAQKEYDLALAKIALEEAQNAKNQVRLQKMANGSWGYVYTQNEKDIAKAEQSYEDKLFALQDNNEKYLDSLGQQVIDIQSEAMEAFRKIAAMTDIDEEEKRARLEETFKFYDERLKFITSEMDKTLAYDDKVLGDAKKFSDTFLGLMYPDMDDADSIYEQFQKKMLGDGENKGLIDQMLDAASHYKTVISELTESSVEGTGKTFEQTLTDNLTNLNTGLNNYTVALEAYTTQLLAAIKKLQENETKKPASKNEMPSEPQSVTVPAGTIPDIDLDAIAASALSKITIDEMEGVVAQNLLKDYYKSLANKNMLLIDYLKVEGYNTGGYTGEWGPEGKLAVLHEKEIVLNAGDTKNLLHVMEIMDQVIKNIDLSARAAASSNLRTPVVTGRQDALAQEVTIHAEFPNATNHSEIEEAFNTLINRAAQYANRN